MMINKERWSSSQVFGYEDINKKSTTLKIHITVIIVKLRFGTRYHFQVFSQILTIELSSKKECVDLLEIDLLFDPLLTSVQSQAGENGIRGRNWGK